MRCLSRSSTRLGRGLLDRGFAGLALEQADEGLQRVVAFGAAVEDQVLGASSPRAASSLCSGRILLTWTMAPVMPRLQAWSRKTEFSTWRAAGLSPNETFDRPRMIWHLGQFLGDALDGVQRLQRQFAVVFVAGADGEGQRIEQQVGRRQSMLIARAKS